MLRESVITNMSIQTIERVLQRANPSFVLKDSYKTALSILIPTIVFKDGCIILMSTALNQINRELKKHNCKVNVIEALLAYDIVTHIDMYGAMTIPLSLLLNKLYLNKETISKYGTDKFSKKILTHATQSLVLSELLSHLGIPKPLAVALINIILEVYYSDTDKEAKMLFENNIAFKNCKASDIPHIINTMELEKIFVSTAILVIVVSIGFNISSSILLVSIVSELYLVLKCEYRERHLKGFLK